MKKMPGKSATEMPLPIEIDPEPAEEKLTALGGIALLVQAYRSLGVGASVRQHVQIKERQRGYDESSFVESFVILNAVGGECLDDFERLREDGGLAEMIGHELPSADAARRFLYEFHQEERIDQARAQLRLGQKAYIVGESEALSGLGAVNRELVGAIGRRCEKETVATVDQDATLIESRKQEALPTYEGFRGYQPMLAVWAEMDLVLADEFRDGNVPADMKPLAVARAAFAALPESVKTFYYRGDSACHESELIGWLRDEERADGAKGFIGFAISARMTEALRKAVEAVPQQQWQPCGESDAEVIRECADVVFVPGEKYEQKDLKPLRYVGLRMTKRQGNLFADGSRVKHFAIVSNIWNWPAAQLLQWHRKKAGTIEIVHDVIKNELAAGVMPCGRLGANAAWLRLAVISHNVITALKRLALPPELLSARPKRLRFLIFHTAGRLISHARSLTLRLAADLERITLWIRALGLLPLPT